MPLTIFSPHEIAEKCYLSEALLWLAVNRFPYAFYNTYEGDDIREDEENAVEGLEPYIPDEAPLSDEECAKAGLAPCPERQDFETGDYHSDPENAKKLLEIVRADKNLAESDDGVKHWEEELLEAEKFVARQSAWEAGFEAFADLYKTRLFLALREGQLNAFGKQLSKATYAASVEYLEETSWAGWGMVCWEPIPSDFWISNRIDWSACWAEGRDTAYALILIDCAKLIECFPPTKEPVDGVVRIGDVLALDTDKTVSVAKAVRRGRPSYEWDEFHVEVARRIKDSEIPAKQEAFIAEMQVWCKTTWKKDVGRSTLLQKLKPYYDAFIRGSEN